MECFTNSGKSTLDEERDYLKGSVLLPNASLEDRVNYALASTQKLMDYVKKLKTEGIDIQPPEYNEETVLIPVNCWFDKKFFISMFLLRHHKIAGIKISYHEMPQFQIYVKKSNLELIVQASSLATLQGGGVDASDWDTGRPKAVTWKKDYTYLETFKHLENYHPYYSYAHPGPVSMPGDVSSKWIYAINEYFEWEKEFRNNVYSQAIKNYGKMNYGSEYRLYNFVKYIYPDAIFQYRSDWLEQQSLDIFIPSIKCGIEYQGLQHYKPVEYFGGDEKLKQQQDMDYVKKVKCTENGVKLFEWPYNRWITETEVLKQACIWYPGDYSWITHEYLLNSMKSMCPRSVEEFLSSIQTRKSKKKKRTKVRENDINHISSYKIRKYDLSGEYIKDYSSLTEAAKEHKITPITLSKACNGKQKTASGFQWRKVKYGSIPDTLPPVEYDTIKPGEMRPVIQIDEDGVIVQRYESVSAASRAVGVGAKSIRDAANGVQKRAAGLFWSYDDNSI